jgi:class 3 adenylate cyclase
MGIRKTRQDGQGRRGLRFRTKLALALAASTLGVTLGLLAIAERRLAAMETRRFQERFAQQVEILRASRDERAESIRALSRQIAASPVLVAMLRDRTEAPAGFPWKEFGDPRFRPGNGGNGEAGAERPDVATLRAFLPGSSSIMAVMDRDGNLRSFTPGAGVAGQRLSRKRMSESAEEIRALVEEMERGGGQYLGYLVVEDPPGVETAKEVVATPVTDSRSGRFLGAFLMGFPAITPTDRIFDRLGQAGGDGADTGLAATGILLHGRLHSPGLPPEVALALAAPLTRAVSGLGPGQEQGNLVWTVRGVPTSLHFRILNPGSALPKAYQITLFPLSDLQEHLAAMRRNSLAVGGLAVVLSLLVAWFLSRNLSGPVAHLSRATREIGEGRFEARVPVTSRDELGELAGSFNRMAEELALKERYRELLEKVSDEAVAQAMIGGTLDLELGGEIKEATILFCDIRGFTGLTEAMRPDEVIALLNEHMTAMTALVREHQGVVDKFIGDEVMAVFGCLKRYGNDAWLAARCALRMAEERARRNAGAAVPFEIGIGLATGQVVAGCMGSHDRLNYTVLGARVNLAARLAAQAGPGEVWIDAATRRRLGPDAATDPLGDISLRGFSVPQAAFRLRDAGSLPVLPGPEPTPLPARSPAAAAVNHSSA